MPFFESRLDLAPATRMRTLSAPWRVPAGATSRHGPGGQHLTRLPSKLGNDAVKKPSLDVLHQLFPCAKRGG
jgi:hypothetical protein